MVTSLGREMDVISILNQTQWESINAKSGRENGGDVIKDLKDKERNLFFFSWRKSIYYNTLPGGWERIEIMSILSQIWYGGITAQGGVRGGFSI